MTKRIKCFISSDSNSDLSRIESILHKLNVEIQNFYDFSISSSFSDVIKKKIKEADFIIAIVTIQSQNVLFDIGMAEAMGKPIFLLIEHDVKVPFYLEGKMYYQVDWTKNTQLLELSLKNYILDISNQNLKYKKKKSKTIENLTIEYTNEKLIALRNYRSTSFKEIDLINTIMDVFKKINIQAVSELAVAERSRVDIAISNDALTNYFGNPLLIEIKSGNLNDNSIETGQLQLLNYIHKTDAHFGILLYFDKANKRFSKNVNHYPNILLFDLEDFIQGISSHGFDNFLITERNKSVHGLSNFQ